MLSCETSLNTAQACGACNSACNNLPNAVGGCGGTAGNHSCVVSTCTQSYFKDCDGVPVNAADIVVADADGVVVVPRNLASQALKLAQELDFKEHSMYAVIEKLKSIQEAVKQFGRL